MKNNTGTRNEALSVRGLNRSEIATLITDFIFSFLKIAVENRQIGVLLLKNNIITPYYAMQVKGSRKYHYLYFNAANNLDDTSYLITTTSIVRGAEVAELYSRHWKIRFQREAQVMYTGNTRNVAVVGLETKEFNVDNENFNPELIRAFIEKEDGYVRQSAIKRFMKEYRRYQTEPSIGNLVNVWVVVNRFMSFSVRMGGDNKYAALEYVPLRFTEIAITKKKNPINYTSVWKEYEIQNINR